MTEVAFHFNAPDKITYGCRLVRKAYGAGAKVTVTADEDVLRELDTALWTFAAHDFIPHCMVSAEASVLDATPVVLAAQPARSPHAQVLVNLGHAVPTGFERFERLIEVVTLDEADRQAARRRWKHYADRGYAIQKHDLAPKGERA